MKGFALSLLTAIAVNAQQVVTDATSTYKTEFGAIAVETKMGDRIHKKITIPEQPFDMDDEAQADHLNQMT